MSRTGVRVLLLAAGALLIAAGEYRMVFGDDLAARIDLMLGEVGRQIIVALPKLYPGGVAIGIGLFAAGSILMALGLGRLPADTPRAVRAPAVVPRSRFMLAVLGLTIVLASVTAALLQQEHPKRWTVAAWVATLVLGLVVAAVRDRARGAGFGNPFPYRGEALSLAVIVLIDLILVMHDAAHWRWAGTPDEAYFFATAKGLAHGPLRFPLSENGVFGYHPMLSSYYQAAFMKLFGVNAFGWRLSSAAALAGALPGLYVLARQLWNRRVAYVSVALLGTAQLAVGFAHHGYNNVHVYLVVLLSLGILAWAVPRDSLVGYYLAGCIAAFGFFTFHPARFALVLVLLLAWSLGGLSLRRGRRDGTMTMLAAFVLTILPVLANPVESFEGMLAQTAVNAGGDGGSRFARLIQGVLSGAWVGRLWDHWIVAMFHAAWSKTDHFIGNPIADPITAGLAAAAWWMAAASMRRQAGSRFLLPAYVLSVLAIGATSPYGHPPLTRLLFFAPFTALFAALAIDQLARLLGGDGTRPRASAAVVVILVGMAVVWNVATTAYNVRIVNHGYGDGTTSELIRIAETFPADAGVMYIQRRETFMDSVDFVAGAYGMSGRFKYLRPFDQRAVTALQELQGPMLLFYDVREDDKRAQIEGLVSSRFPTLVWQDSDAGQAWNLRYIYIPDSVPAVAAPAG